MAYTGSEGKMTAPLEQGIIAETRGRSIEKSESGLIATSQKRSVNKNGCGDCHLQNLCLSRDLDSTVRAQLASIVKFHSKLSKRQHLYRQGDPFESLYLVRSGSVKSSILSENGDELALSFFMRGELIGLDGLYSKSYTSSVIALEDSYVCEIPLVELERLCNNSPVLQRHFMELQSRQIVQEQEMTKLRGQKTAASRLMAFLKNLSARYERLGQSPETFLLPMTRKEIAGCLGLTLETVSRSFTAFQQQELIVVKGREVSLTNIQSANTTRH